VKYSTAGHLLKIFNYELQYFLPEQAFPEERPKTSLQHDIEQSQNIDFSQNELKSEIRGGSQVPRVFVDDHREQVRSQRLGVMLWE
jgi:hypothetical protein